VGPAPNAESFRITSIMRCQFILPGARLSGNSEEKRAMAMQTLPSALTRIGYPSARQPWPASSAVRGSDERGRSGGGRNDHELTPACGRTPERRGRRQRGTRVENHLRVLLYMGRLAITAAAATTDH